MATYEQAAALRDAVRDTLAREFNVSSTGAGVCSVGGGEYGVRIYLSDRPAGQLPETVLDMRVDYRIHTQRPELL